MKKGLGYFAIAFVAFALAACDSSTSNPADAGQAQVRAKSDLKTCAEDNEGESVLVISTGQYYTCSMGTWSVGTKTISLEDSDEESDFDDGESDLSDENESFLSSAEGWTESSETTMLESSESTTPGSAGTSTPESSESAETTTSSAASALTPLQEYEQARDFIDDGWRDECLRLANEYRATEGVAPLELADDEKQLCAINQAAADMADNKAHGHFGDCDEWAQNSGPNFSTSWRTNATGAVQYYIKSMWENEKALVTSGERDPDKKEDYSYIGHYLNMRKASYTKVACGIAISEDGTKGWFNMNFY